MIGTNLSAQLLIHFAASTAAIFIRFTFHIPQQAIQFTAAIVRRPLAFPAVAVAVCLRLLAPTHSVPISIPTVDSPGLATNVRAVLHLTMLAVPHLVVNVSSVN